MRAWISIIGIIVTIGVLFVYNCLRADNLVQGLSLQQVIDGINFSQAVINSGELKVDLAISPMSQGKSSLRDINRLKESLEPIYQHTRDPLSKAHIKEMLLYYEDILTGRGYPRHYECFVSFRLNQTEPDHSTINLTSLYSYRMSMINRLSECAGPGQLSYLSRMRRQSVTLQEIQTEILDPGAEFCFFLNEQLKNVVRKELSGEFMKYYLFSAGHPLLSEINYKQVVEFGPVKQDGKALYYIGYNPEILSSGAGNPGRKDPVFKIWVDPAKEFSIVKGEIFSQTKTLQIIIQYDDFRMFPGGFWFPIFINITYKLEQMEPIQYSYKVHEAEFNIPIPHDFFEVREGDFVESGISVR